MSRRRAMEGTPLASLVRMAIPLCRQARQRCPRTGPGRPPDYDDWIIAIFIMVAILKKRKSKSAQYRFLSQHQAEFKRWLPLKRIPARSSYFARYGQAYRLFEVAIALQGQKALAEGVTSAETVAVDKTLFTARGPCRHRRQGKPCRTRRGVDEQADWGYSDYHGWVYGYSLETVVSATKDALVFPLLASASWASQSECKSVLGKISQLPDQTRYVLVDRAYDSNRVGEAVEYTANGTPTGRHLICPLIGRAGKPKVGRSPHRGRREQLRRRRQKRLAFFESPQGRKLYAQRSKSVEPFHEWFKSRFDLNERVWHRGLANNQTQLLAAMFAYQLLVRYNHRHGHNNGQIQWILDTI